nr:hypothetical protein B0A51_12471 [Rachicladosporium sp. CCFEE 5018]
MDLLPRATEGPNFASFAPITEYDHAGYIWIAALYCMSVSLLVLFTRAYIKKNTFGNDDWSFVASCTVMLAQVIALFVALKNGLGSSSALHYDTPTDEAQIGTAGRATMAADMLLIIALALGKISVILFIQRLLSRDLRTLNLACYALCGVYAVWGLASVITIGAMCNGPEYVADGLEARCGDQSARWGGIAAFDVLTELTLIVMPFVIVWPLQMSTKLKLQVTSAFSFRLGVAALAVTHAVYASRLPRSAHPSLASIPRIALAEAELCWSIVSATIPNLKSFMSSFNTGFGHNDFAFTVTGSNYDMNGSRSKSGNHNIPLSNMSRNRSNGRATPGFMESLRPEGHGYEVEVRGQQQDSASVGSGQSEEMIIRKQVIMTVDRDQGAIMATVSLLNVSVRNNPAAFDAPYEFEITFECLEPLQKDLEWKLTYVGSATSSEHDQELDSLLVGPIPVGVNKFVFEADPPDLSRIPDTEILGVTVILLTCSYDNREFVRVGYYVNNEYTDESLIEEPPVKPILEKVRRSILAEKPRVTRFAIKWDSEESAPAEFPPEQPDVDAQEDDGATYGAEEEEEEEAEVGAAEGEVAAKGEDHEMDGVDEAPSGKNEEDDEAEDSDDGSEDLEAESEGDEDDLEDEEAEAEENGENGEDMEMDDGPVEGVKNGVPHAQPDVMVH